MPETTSYVSPAVASIIFSIGTGALGGVASLILAKRIEKSAGVSLPVLLLVVGAASALNVIFALNLPYIEAEVK